MLPWIQVDEVSPDIITSAFACWCETRIEEKKILNLISLEYRTLIQYKWMFLLQLFYPGLLKDLPSEDFIPS